MVLSNPILPSKGKDMSNGNKEQNEKSGILQQLTSDKQAKRSIASLSNRDVCKQAIATVIFQDNASRYGVIGLLGKKQSITRAIIQDLKLALDMVDEVYDNPQVME